MNQHLAIFTHVCGIQAACVFHCNVGHVVLTLSGLFFFVASVPDHSQNVMGSK